MIEEGYTLPKDIKRTELVHIDESELIDLPTLDNFDSSNAIKQAASDE